MQRGLALSSFLLATTLHAQDDPYRHAYLSHVEGEVSLQRAAESEPESGALNVPILPGDRLWTRSGSRAEIRFGSGLVVHLSEGAKLDFVDTDPVFDRLAALLETYPARIVAPAHSNVIVDPETLVPSFREIMKQARKLEERGRDPGDR